ncbi:MAG: hypothetical protein IPK16_13065 [Anaerolineales bacterium]|nr:hypothetical protein [Anaerolineales bacterium]
MATQKNATLYFNPNPLVRSASAQTMLAMVRPRHLDITLDERPMLLDAGDDLTGMNEGGPVRMIGYYNASRTPGVNRGLVMILHGWEGCSHSNFNLIMAQTMVEQGYDTFRLNLRDHGPQIHVDPYTLNRGLFLGTLIEEAAAATRQVAALARAPILHHGRVDGWQLCLTPGAGIANARRFQIFAK